MVIKIKYISLVNLIMDNLVIPELIQEDCTPEKITEEMRRLLAGEYRKEMLKNYIDLSLRMGDPGASEKTAGLIVKNLIRQ